MPFSLTSHTKLHMNLTLAVLAVMGAAALSAPAFADAKQKDVVAACKRTKGCEMGYVDGGAYGCSPHACFVCNNGKCHSVRSSGGGRLKYKPMVGSTVASASATGIRRGNAAPVKVAAPGNNHVRTGGRH